MPDGARSIIIGGGIAALLPFTTGRVTYISDNDPPTVGATSVAQFTTGTGGTHPALVISATPDTDPQPGANETIRIVGGLISESPAAADSTVIGRGAVAASLAIAIGQGSSATASNSVALGHSATANPTGNVAIGGVATATGNLGTAVGGGATAGAGANATAIGNGARATGADAVAIGQAASATAIGAIAVGSGTIANVTGTIVLGTGATANGFKVIIVAGGVVTARADEQIWMIAGGNTPNTAGATGGCIILSGNTSAGNAYAHADNIIIGMRQPSFLVNCAVIGGIATPITTVVLGRGNTSTAAVAAGLTIRGTDGITTADLNMGPLTIIAPRSTGNVVTGKIIFQTGAPGASGATLQAATTQFEVLPSAGGANAAGVNLANLTNGAAAAAGTLLNSPVAGNPTFWAPIQINGVQKFIPCW